MQPSDGYDIISTLARTPLYEWIGGEGEIGITCSHCGKEFRFAERHTNDPTWDIRMTKHHKEDCLYRRANEYVRGKHREEPLFTNVVMITEKDEIEIYIIPIETQPLFGIDNRVYVQGLYRKPWSDKYEPERQGNVYFLAERFKKELLEIIEAMPPCDLEAFKEYIRLNWGKTFRSPTSLWMISRNPEMYA